MKAVTLRDRVRGCLWGLFAGDALAAPTHWFYGGAGQVKEHYGPGGIRGYVKPSHELAGSIMNKSNVNGAGRGSFEKAPNGVSIIGDVICHGKRELWDPAKQIHYHATLAAGENTLEAQLGRVLMRTITADNGEFVPAHFVEAYVEFMTTPGSHNDTYASTCHRMFFANRVLKKKPLAECPDNDEHNVDTADGLVLPTIAALAGLARLDRQNGASTPEEARMATLAALAAATTRKSDVLDGASQTWARLLHAALYAPDDNQFGAALAACARSFGVAPPNPKASGSSLMAACYLQSNMETTLHMLAKQKNAWSVLLENANVGGENVHRGMLLGAVAGARSSAKDLPREMVEGLRHYKELHAEIEAFVDAVCGRSD